MRVRALACTPCASRPSVTPRRASAPPPQFRNKIVEGVLTVRRAEGAAASPEDEVGQAGEACKRVRAILANWEKKGIYAAASLEQAWARLAEAEAANASAAVATAASLGGAGDRNNSVALSQAERAGDAVNGDHSGYSCEEDVPRSLRRTQCAVNRSCEAAARVEPLAQHAADFLERPRLFFCAFGMGPTVVETGKLKMGHPRYCQIVGAPSDRGRTIRTADH